MAKLDATQRGTWRVDEETGELVEQVRADSYADRCERERLVVQPGTARREAVVNLDRSLTADVRPWRTSAPGERRR